MLRYILAMVFLSVAVACSANTGLSPKSDPKASDPRPETHRRTQLIGTGAESKKPILTRDVRIRDSDVREAISKLVPGRYRAEVLTMKLGEAKAKFNHSSPNIDEMSDVFVAELHGEGFLWPFAPSGAESSGKLGSATGSYMVLTLSAADLRVIRATMHEKPKH